MEPTTAIAPAADVAELWETDKRERDEIDRARVGFLLLEGGKRACMVRVCLLMFPTFYLKWSFRKPINNVVIRCLCNYLLIH